MIIELEDLWKVYGRDETAVAALRGVDLHIDEGEYVAIMGASGSGKSTLMNILGCLDQPTAGTYRLAEHDVSGLDEDALALVRNRMIGFVFQSFHLIPRMSARANVELPMVYGGRPAAERHETAREALALVGLADRAGHRPNELSGGQQQRVAIARALTMSPRLLLADEPTGNLDSTSSHDVMDLLTELNEQGRTVVLITHEDDVAARARRVVRVGDGRIAADSAAAEAVA